MDWIKKYGWYILIVFICSISSRGIFSAIDHKNIGSLADWVSGLCSVVAIGIAYYQIYEQKKEYEKDKRDANERFEFNNRSQFSISYLDNLDINDENYFINEIDIDLLKINIYSKFVNYGKECYVLKNEKRAYQFINVTDNVAINVNIEIGYANNIESDRFLINYIPKRSKAILFTHQMLINENENSFLDIEKQTKYIKLYFESLSGQQYVQVWDKSTFMPKEKTKIIDIMSSETTVTKEKPDGSNTINFTLDEFI